jgi:hypothetical protein
MPYLPTNNWSPYLPTYLPTYLPFIFHWLNFYPPSKNFYLFLVKPLFLDKTYIF